MGFVCGCRLSLGRVPFFLRAHLLLCRCSSAPRLHVERPTSPEKN